MTTNSGSPVIPSASKRLIPPLPPVKPSNFLITIGVATAIPKVASARYGPESLSAGSPNAVPAAAATRPAIPIVQRSLIPWSATRIAVVYAPIAMNAPCPSEIAPV